MRGDGGVALMGNGTITIESIKAAGACYYRDGRTEAIERIERAIGPDGRPAREAIERLRAEGFSETDLHWGLFAAGANERTLSEHWSWIGSRDIIYRREAVEDLLARIEAQENCPHE